MKKPLIFDNDCLSSFLWIKRIDILITLFNKEVIVPEAVVFELSKMKKYSKYRFVYDDLEEKIKAGLIVEETIPATSIMAQEYASLIDMTNPKRIGRGEAASIVLAKKLNGTLASNNLSDVLPHIINGVPPYICTDEILYMYFKNGFITIAEGKTIWRDMKNFGRKLPNYDFDEVVNRFNNNVGSRPVD